MRASRMISVVGCHAAGEIGDVIVGGVVPPAGATMFEKMQTMQRDHDYIRRFLLCEPRGSVVRHLNLIVPSTRPDCDIGVIIMEPTEYVPMSGSNTICAVTVLLETGMLPMHEPETRVVLDMPGGQVTATAFCRDGKCVAVEFENVPSFAHTLDAWIELDGFGKVRVDVAYGGMFYAIVDAARFDLELVPKEARRISDLGERVRLACREQLEIVHPGNPAIRGVSIVQFAGPFRGKGEVSRNNCVVAPGRLDRSPTGTGLSARMAVLHARGELAVGDGMSHESVIGSRFDGRIVAATTIADIPAIVPSISGSAWITGIHNYLLDPSDPWPEGYVLSDTWGVSGTIEQ